MATSYNKFRTFCLIYAVTPPAEEAFLFAHNEKHLANSEPRAPKRVHRSREGTPLAGDFKSVIALTFDLERMFDPRLGHTFGSGEDCDIRLARNNGTGVSGKHFRVRLNYDRKYPNNLIIRNLSQHGTEVGGTRLVPGDEARLRTALRTTVVAGDVYLQIEPLAPRLDDGAFLSNWEDFRNQALAAIPTVAGLHLARAITDPTPYVGRVRDAANTVRGVSGDEYEVISKAGNGTFGVVMQVSRLRDGKIMAMKRLHSPTTGQKRKATSSGSGSLRHELELVRRLSHANINTYTDYAEVLNGVNLCMEFAEQGDLDRHLQRIGRLSEHDAGIMAWQLLGGLQYLHSHDIIHRDVKPENILIFGLDSPLYKLADFGLSRLVEAYDSSTLTVCGTHEYAAPEIFPDTGRRSSYNSRVDIWSLGVVLWRTLTGQFLFLFRTKEKRNNDYVRATLLRWIPDEKFLSQFVTSEGRALLLDMLTKDPKNRPNADDCLESLWFSFLANPKCVSIDVVKDSSVASLQADSKGSVAKEVLTEQGGTQTNEEEIATELVTEENTHYSPR